MQQIDVHAVGLIREVGRDEDGEPLGMRRARSAVGTQSRQLALRLHQLRIGIHDLRGLAVQGKRDGVALVRKPLHRILDAAHHEFEVRDVVALVLRDHQEVVLVTGRTVQPVATIEHVDLESRYAKPVHQHRDLGDLPAIQRRQMEGIVHMESAGRYLQGLRVELFVRPALVEIVLSGTKVVEARRHASLCGGATLGYRVLRERGIDAGVHMRVDDAGQRQVTTAVDDCRGSAGDCRAHGRDLAVANGDVASLHGRLARAHDANVLDEQVILGFGWHRGLRGDYGYSRRSA